MPLRQRRPCVRPAVVVLSSGAKTDHSEPMRTRATLAVSPWLFIRWSSLPIRKTSELPDFRTSELPNFQTHRRFGRGFCDLYPVGVFFAQTGRRPSAAKKLGDDAVLQQSGPFLPRWSRPHRVGKTGIGEDIARRGHFGSVGIASSPADLPVQGGEKRRPRKATFANQLRGVVAFAESPWPLTRTQTGADEKSARCAILAGAPWIILRGS